MLPPRYSSAQDAHRAARRFKRKAKRFAITAVVMVGVLAGATFEAAMIQRGIVLVSEQERVHVEHVARERVAKECGRAL